MSKKTASLIFRLATHLSSLRSRLEEVWIEPEREEGERNLTPFYRTYGEAVGDIYHLFSTAEPRTLLPQARNELRDLASALNGLCRSHTDSSAAVGSDTGQVNQNGPVVDRTIETALQDPDRASLEIELIEAEPCIPGNIETVERMMVELKAFKDVWTPIDERAKAFQERLPPDLKNVYRLASLLADEFNRTYTGGQRTEEPGDRWPRWHGVLARELSHMLEELHKDFPGSPKISIPKETDFYAMLEQFRRAHEELDRWLADSSATEHLGLVLLDNGIVRRGDQEIRLTRPLLWNVLVRLVSRAGDYADRAYLAAAWDDHLTVDERSMRQRIHTAISNLKRELKTLGIAIENTRNYGWGLVEINQTGQERENS
jgi:hypothetical protein